MDHLTKRVDFIQTYLDGIFSEDLHAKRVKSLTNGTLGVMTSASLAVSIIGRSLAQARGLLSKHAVKQVDRLLSNQGIVVWDMFAPWVAEIVGQRKTIVVAMDWTDFGSDSILLKLRRPLVLVSQRNQCHAICSRLGVRSLSIFPATIYIRSRHSASRSRLFVPCAAGRPFRRSLSGRRPEPKAASGW